MTVGKWMEYFRRFSRFELEGVGSVDKGERVMMLWNFARIDGQSQTCLQAIKMDDTLKGVVEVNYGLDPCGLVIG